MKVQLSDSISYYSYSFNTTNLKDIISTSYKIAESVNSSTDGHGLWDGLRDEDSIRNISNIGELKNLILNGVEKCKKIYTKSYNLVLSSAWINIVRANNPIQKIRNSDGTLAYHSHSVISNEMNQPIPQYTFIFYLQMPNNLTNDDGKLFMMDGNKNEFSTLPYEGQLIILDGDVPHAPVDALKSDKDRIVLAGNVVFADNKNNKTLF